MSFAKFLASGKRNDFKNYIFIIENAFFFRKFRGDYRGPEGKVNIFFFDAPSSKIFCILFCEFFIFITRTFFSLCYTHEKKIIKKHILEHTKWSTKEKKVSLAPQGFRRRQCA